MENTGKKAENVITTYMERGLHLSLKRYFCPDESLHELKIGRFVADAYCDGTVFEIQTGNLSPLRKKIHFYLENTDFNILIVKPIAQNRRIFWLDEDSGELVKSPRLSSRHETLAHGISDIYYLNDLLGCERLSFCFPIMEIDEIRLLDGYGNQKKIRATSVDRLAGEIYSVEYIKSLNDIRDAVFSLLPDGPFSRDELSKNLKLKTLKLWSMQKLLTDSGLLSVKKDGKRLVFEKNGI